MRRKYLTAATLVVAATLTLGACGGHDMSSMSGTEGSDSSPSSSSDGTADFNDADVTFATDHPVMDKRKLGEIKIGGGPVLTRGANVNPVVFEGLVAAAAKKKIPYQIDAASGGTGTDANAMQLRRAGVATGLVSVPQRYMHTPVEVLSLDDLDNTVKLLTEFVLGVDEKTDFTP